MRAGARLGGAGIVLALALLAGNRWLPPVATAFPALRDEVLLGLLGLLGLIVYGAAVSILFGREWLAVLRRRAGSPPPGSH
jgi:hypothetical protein